MIYIWQWEDGESCTLWRRQTNPKSFRLPLASLMPPTSHPPPTWRRFAATSAIFLFLLLPTPLPSAGAQPASAPPFVRVLLIALWTIFLIPICLFGFLFSLRYPNFLNPYDFDTVLVSPPPTNSSSITATFGSFGTHLFVAEAIVLVIIIFLLLLYPSLFSLILEFLEPVDYTDHAVRLRHLGSPRGIGLSTIETFPTVVYSAVKGHKIGKASLECAVCLNDFEDDDTLRLIPKCNHAFHPDCIAAWLASHRTCPVCRDVLSSQPAGDSAIQLAQSGTEPPLVEVKVEAATSDGGAPEGSRREGQRERIQPPDLKDENDSGRFSNPNRTRGSGRTRRFPRSHSAGHSLIRPGEDTERFTLRLPAEARKQLMGRPRPVLSPVGCSTRGYRCGGEGSSPGRYFSRPDRLDRAAKSERWAFDGVSPRMAIDGDGGSSSGSVQQARSAI